MHINTIKKLKETKRDYKINHKFAIMRLKFIEADTISHKAKATIHQTGKLGFSTDAVPYLDITENKSIRFAINEDDPNDDNLYGVIIAEDTGSAFKIYKAGDYFYVNTKGLFDSLGIEYKQKRIIYDIIKIKIENEEIIKFVKREIIKKEKESEDLEQQ